MSVEVGAGNLVLCEVSQGVAIITLNDTERRNILSRELCGALIAWVGQLASRDDVKVLVVTGNGKAFCAGAELDVLLAAGDGDLAGIEQVYAAFGAIAEFPKPTIAAVNGPAVGAGLNLALACDVRIAAVSARFDCRFLTIGIHQGGGHAWMLSRLVGPQAAAAMLIFGQILSGKESVERGLAWVECADDELLGVAQEFAGKAAKASAILLSDMKSSLRQTPDLPSRDEAMSIEKDRQLASLRRPEAEELIKRMRASISKG